MAAYVGKERTTNKLRWQINWPTRSQESTMQRTIATLVQIRAQSPKRPGPTPTAKSTDVMSRQGPIEGKLVVAETANQNVPRVLEPEAQVTIAIFGGLRLWRNGHEVEIGSQRQRIVLAELICAAGNVVSISTLIDAVWNQDPAASAVNQLHRIVGQLRRTLEPGLSPHAVGTTILASGNGYRIAVEQVQCDLYQLRELRRKAKNLADGGDLQTAARCYAEALELAQGALFGGLNSRVETRPEFLAVEQERVSTAIAAADIAIDQGSALQVLAGVTAIAASDPLNEPLHVHLIKLLDATGRRAEALATFDAVRRRLADELGVDPGTELASAYADLLSSDAENAAPTSAAAVRPVNPAQLPRTVAGFIHRADAEAVLAEDLADTGGTVVITAFGGMGGIGKTALAVQWAHQLADQFPDGQLFINLRGFDPDGRATHPDEALNVLLEGLGQSVAGLTELDTESRSARYRSLIAGRRMIIVLDNAQDAEQVRPLLPGSPACLVIVTSRNRLTSLIAREGARYVPLGRLTPSESRALLAKRLGSRRLNEDPTAVDQIVAGCAGLPLALAIVAARIASNHELSMAKAASFMFDRSSTLDALSLGNSRDDVRTIFSWSYEQLSADAGSLFRRLAAHPGADWSLTLLVNLADLGNGQASAAAAELVQAHLLTHTTDDRFVMHDLLRAYAGELLNSTNEGKQAQRLVVDHYLLAVRSAYLTFGRAPIADLGPLAAGLVTENSRDRGQAMDWYVRERSSIQAVVDLAMITGSGRAAMLIMLDRRPMSQALDRQTDALPQCLRVLEAALKTGKLTDADGSAVAELHRDIAYRFSLTNTEDNATRATHHYDEALLIFRTINDLGGQSNTYRSLATQASRNGDHQLALKHLENAVQLAKRGQRSDLIAVTMVFQVEELFEIGEYREVVRTGNRALDMLRQQKLTYMEPSVHVELAAAYLELGDATRSLSTAELGLTVIESSPDPVTSWGLLAIASAAAMGCGKINTAEAYVEEAHEMSRVHGEAIQSLGSELKGRHDRILSGVVKSLDELTRS